MANSSRALSSATRALTLEYKNLQEEPVEGFRVKLADDSNIFEWEVAIFGPPDTIYQGGYFKAKMTFPKDYPYSPPSIRFLSHVWHPNVYTSGKLCISILHPPINEVGSGELTSERWSPVRNARTVLLSVISLLNEPNTSSPANIDASVMYRRWKEGKDDQYVKLVKHQVQISKVDAEKEGVVVPLTIEDYCNEVKEKIKATNEYFDKLYYHDYDDFDNIFYDDVDDDDDDDDDDDYDDDDDDDDDDEDECDEGDAHDDAADETDSGKDK